MSCSLQLTAKPADTAELMRACEPHKPSLVTSVFCHVQVSLPSAPSQTSGTGDVIGSESARSSASTKPGNPDSSHSSADLPDGEFQKNILAAVGTYEKNQSMQQQSYTSTQIADYSSVST